MQEARLDASAEINVTLVGIFQIQIASSYSTDS